MTNTSQNIWKVLQVILWAFVQIWWIIVSKNRLPVFYGDLVYKPRSQRRSEFVSSDSKIVKYLRCRKYDPVITERTIGLDPFTALYNFFLEHCDLTNKAMGTIWWDLSKPWSCLFQRRQDPDPRPFWLLIGISSDLGPDLASRWV